MKYRHALSAPEWRKYLEGQENLKITNLMEKKRKHQECIEKKKKKKEEEEKTKIIEGRRKKEERWSEGETVGRKKN